MDLQINFFNGAQLVSIITSDIVYFDGQFQGYTKFTNKGDNILDPFMGSGTIPLVCMLHDRESLCIENNEDYYNLAVKRLKGSNKNKNVDAFELLSC